MQPDRLEQPGRPEQKPIYRLIQTKGDNLPEHFKANRVEDGRVVEDTDKGSFRISIVALPPEDAQSGLGKFWSKVKVALGSKQSAAAELPPTPVAARSQLYSDEFTPGKHVQLMGHMPYIVLEDGTRYGIAVNVPAGLQGEWENFEAPADDDGLFELLKSTSKIEIGKKRKGLAVVVRTDDGQPLTRRDLERAGFQAFQEILSGGFRPVESDPSREQLLVDNRTTVRKGSDLGVGEEQKSQSTQGHLLFSALGGNEGVGTVNDKKGRIEVVVYEVVERIVSEIIEKSLPGLMDTRSRFEDAFTYGGGMRSLGVGGGFSAGETSFGKETRKKVNVQGVIVEKPLAAFQVVLVGELPEQKMEMAVRA